MARVRVGGAAAGERYERYLVVLHNKNLMMMIMMMMMTMMTMTIPLDMHTARP